MGSNMGETQGNMPGKKEEGAESNPEKWQRQPPRGWSGRGQGSQERDRENKRNIC